MEPVKITSIHFDEHTSVLRSSFNAFEIVVFPHYSHEKYCQALFQKMREIESSKVPLFLSYHCERVRRPLIWLNQLEKLISLNAAMLSDDSVYNRPVRWLSQIEFKRYKQEEEYKALSKPPVVSLVNEPHVYDFEAVKEQLKNLETYEEKVLFLKDEIYTYRQNPPVFVKRKKPTFDKQCELEIMRLNDMQELNEKLLAKKQLQTDNQPLKLPFNGELKVFCDVFYKLMNTTLADGRPKLPWSITQATQHICNSYCDENGNPLSPSTVRTYLSPSKIESRPKKHKEMDIDDIIKPERKKLL